MTEHYFHARPALGLGKVELDNFKGRVRLPAPPDGNAAVGWIADIANATKHVEGKVRKDGSARPGYKDVKVERLNQYGIARFGWPMGGNEVLVGQQLEWRLSDLVNAAMVFWKDRLAFPHTAP